MMLHEITQAVGARHRRKRVGRGESSGMGKTCGRGNKGAQSRSGYRGKMLHQGGQMRIFQRMAKRGFNNFNFRTEYEPVNLADIEARFDAGARVDAAALHDRGLVSGPRAQIKILGDGELTRKIDFTVHAISGAARASIAKVGGEVTLIGVRDSAALWKSKRKSAKGRKRAASPSRLEKKQQRSS